MTTRAERAAIAAERRAIALRLRAAGKTWADVGRHLGVSASRAVQIARPTKRAGNPRRAAPQWAGTIGELIERRARDVDEAVRAHAHLLREVK